MSGFLRVGLSSSSLSIIMLYSLADVSADTITKSYKTMPSMRLSKSAISLDVYKRQDIIKAKYISFVVLFLFGIIMGSITALSICVSSGFSDIQSVLYGYEFGLTLSATTAGIMFPLILKIGTEKNEIIMILSAIASIGLLLIVSAVLTPLTGEMNIKHSLVGIVSTIVALVIFVSSYFVSVKIYGHKEIQ